MTMFSYTIAQPDTRDLKPRPKTQKEGRGGWKKEAYFDV